MVRQILLYLKTKSVRRVLTLEPVHAMCKEWKRKHLAKGTLPRRMGKRAMVKALRLARFEMGHSMSKVTAAMARFEMAGWLGQSGSKPDDPAVLKPPVLGVSVLAEVCAL